MAARPPYGRLLGRLLRGAFRGAVASGPPGPPRPRRILLLALFVPAFLLLQLAHWVGLLLDEVLFPGYRRVTVRAPLFVVGMPRSGTSFLQRVLAADPRFTTLRLWELLLAPSITERRIWLGLSALDRTVGRPLGRLREAVEGLAFRWMEDVHPVSMAEPEEDYLLLLPAFACFLLVVPFPYHEDLWSLTRFDGLPDEERDRVVAFYRSCVQRHLYVVGKEKQLLSKNPSFTPMLRSLVRAFPDARVVCCVRDPREAAPSLLSSLAGGARAFGWDPADPPLRDRFLEMLEGFVRHALSVLPALPEDRHAFLPLERLTADVEGEVLRIYRRFGWEAAPDLRRRLERAVRRSRRYTSDHAYALEEFGLDAGEVDRRFPELGARFGYGGGPPAPEAPPSAPYDAPPPSGGPGEARP